MHIFVNHNKTCANIIKMLFKVWVRYGFGRKCFWLWFLMDIYLVPFDIILSCKYIPEKAKMEKVIKLIWIFNLGLVNMLYIRFGAYVSL